MPVMILDVPESAWNEVVVQSVLFGLDICPDSHQEKTSTIVEITGSWEKLNAALIRMRKKGPEFPHLLEVMESKLIEQCSR